MNIFSSLTPGRGRIPLAVVAGLLWAAAFPRLGVAGFAWLAPGLMLLAGLGTRGKESFRLGYLAGLTHYLVSLHWLLFIPYQWHGVPVGPAAGWLALAAYLALYPAIWVVLAGKIAGRRLRVAGSMGERTTWLKLMDTLMSLGWVGRQAWAMACAAIWVGLEMAMSWLLGGFPWNLLGASQHQIVPLIQLASLTGVYGVSFLVAWTSVCLLSAGAAVVSRPTTRGLWMAELLLPITAVAGAFVFGFYRLAESPAATRELRVTLVQPSIPQTLIWDASSNAARFQDLLRLTEQALTNRTDLLIWPESAIPNLLRYNLETFTAVTNLAAGHHVWMIVGSDDAMPAAHPRNPQDADYFNSSFLISPEGRLAGEYRKRNLVIFGEYIPLEHTIPFLKWFTPVQGSFTPGTRAAAFDLGDLDLRTSVLICYEDVFPQLGRQCSDLDADFLVNITNDGWFGDSAAQWQHADSALFRAVENGVPLIRCTNNGLTCWFDAYGRLGGLFTDSHETVYGPGFMTVTVPLPSRADRAPTLYDRGGYWFGWACAAFTALVAVPVTVGLRRKTVLE